MNTEPKPFASLSSGLLARKGAARPAMRPQGFGGAQPGAGLEDLGWNDMGFEPPKAAEAERDAEHDAFGEELTPHPTRNPLAALTPVGSPVHDQQAEIVERFAEAEEADEPVEAGESIEVEADESVEVEIDDTAELYEPEAEAEVEEAPQTSPVLTKPLCKPAVVAVVPVPAPRRAPRPRSFAGSKAKAAFTLRLDPDRHLKLRLACAVDGRSAQQLVTDALDHLLERMPDLDGLAQKAKRGGNTNEQAAS